MTTQLRYFDLVSGLRLFELNRYAYTLATMNCQCTQLLSLHRLCKMEVLAQDTRDFDSLLDQNLS